MSQKATSSIFKKLAGFLHVIFAAVALVGIGFMYLNSNYGRGLDWIYSESYEESPTFNKKVQSDITDLFNYIQYQDIFETNGVVDYTKTVLEVSSGPGGDKTYTLNDIILYGKALGYYMDESDNYTLYGPSEDYIYSEEERERLYVQWRCYQSEDELTGPEQSYATLPELTYEILKRYASYYSIYDRLMSDFTNLYYRVAFYSKKDTIFKIYSNAPEMSIDDMMAMGKYIYYSGDTNDLTVRTNFASTFPSIPNMMQKINPYNSTNNYFILGLDTKYTAKDDYQAAHSDYSSSTETFILGANMAIIGVVGAALTMIYMIFVSGHRSLSDKEVRLYPFDKIKTDFMLLLTVVVIQLGVVYGAPLLAKSLHFVVATSYWIRANRMMMFGIIYFCGLIAFFSLVRRYKSETLWTNSFLHDIVASLSKGTFRYRLMGSFTIFLLANSFVIAIGTYYIWKNGLNATRSTTFTIGLLVWLVGNLVAFYYLYRSAQQIDEIHDGIEKLASGETSYKIDTMDFTGLEEDLAEGLNRISDGLETALAEQVKSERLKADLITNVSHDIKTPLTSIINYVDLIRREKIEDPKIQGYLEVLDQKSHRLKTLTEDLVEASKASSGNIKLEMNEIDLVELVQQTNGEFEEKLMMRHLELVNSLPNEVILIEADGRRLWRVLENLYNNACKYALEYTRVYVGVEDRGGEVVFSIKNVSSAPLNISPDELTERFVRGDVSRTTEGSGLGLSIAKDLTHLQGGRFQLTIDGDLFKAEIGFPIKN